MNVLCQNGNILVDEVASDVFNQLKEQKKGVFYNSILIIMGEEEFTQQEKTQTKIICDLYGIKSNSYYKDEFVIIHNNLVKLMEKEHPLLNKSNFILKPLRQIVNTIRITEITTEMLGEIDRMGLIKFIVVAACLAVGIPYCLKYIERQNKKEQQKSKKNQSLSFSSKRNQEFSPPVPVPASLCLVIPSRIASALDTYHLLDTSRVESLIDNASYFLCTKKSNTESYEQRLKLTDEEISPNSQREVYIRIDISDGGRELPEKKSRYYLKSNLPSNAQFELKQLSCLKDLSGLDEFNRV